MIALRNIAIVALLALALTVIPGGGTVAWLAIVGVSVYLLVTTWRDVSSY